MPRFRIPVVGRCEERKRFGFGMPFSLGGLSWLTPNVAPPASDGQPNKRPPQENARGDPALPPPKKQQKRQRSRRAPVGLAAFTASLDQNNESCCKRLSCAASFASPTNTTHDAGLLRAEQDRFAALSGEKDRKWFMSQRVSYSPLALGSMIAADRPVCTKFFTTIFGVSKGLVDSVKGLAGARASSSTDR